MKKIISFVAGVALCLTATSCKISIEKNTGESECFTTKTLEVGHFNSLTLCMHGDLILTQDSVVNVTVEAPEGKIDSIKWTIHNGELRFWYEPVNNKNKRKIVLFGGAPDYCIRVSTPDIESIQIEGSGEMTVNDFVLSHPLGLTVAGSGDIETGMISAPEITASVAGSGDIDLKTKNAAQVNLRIAGSGDIDALLLDCGGVRAEVAGSGDIELKGSARDFVKSIVGSGNIDDKELKIIETPEKD